MIKDGLLSMASKFKLSQKVREKIIAHMTIDLMVNEAAASFSLKHFELGDIQDLTEEECLYLVKKDKFQEVLLVAMLCDNFTDELTGFFKKYMHALDSLVFTPGYVTANSCIVHALLKNKNLNVDIFEKDGVSLLESEDGFYDNFVFAYVSRHNLGAVRAETEIFLCDTFKKYRTISESQRLKEAFQKTSEVKKGPAL